MKNLEIHFLLENICFAFAQTFATFLNYWIYIYLCSHGGFGC